RRAFGIGALAFAAAPLAAQAQTLGRTYRLAVWNAVETIADAGENGELTDRAFFQELRRLGFVVGGNLRVARDSAAEPSERTARAIIESQPDVIIIHGSSNLRLLTGLSTRIPIVAPVIGDSIASRLTPNLVRPRGNFTGVTSDGGIPMYGLRLQL